MNYYAPYQHTPTSIDAAIQIKPHIPTLYDKIFAFIKANPGCSDEDIALRLAISPSTARPRRIELERDGKIMQRGLKKTMSGRNAKTWEAVVKIHFISTEKTVQRRLF